MKENLTAIATAKQLIIDGKATCVVIKNDKIIATEKARGVKPIIQFYREGILEGAVVVDKIIGKAAAMILSLGKVELIYGLTMSRVAIDWLKRNQLDYKCEQETDMIINRKGDGRCPMEETVLGVNDAIEGLNRVLKKLEEL